MNSPLIFLNRSEFRSWLQDHKQDTDGIWIQFGKPGGPQTMKAHEALEEALCFGWIDGQMKKLDDVSYQKYFALRRANSKWSEKNKQLVSELEKRGIMTEWGRAKIMEAKQNGQWDAPKSAVITDTQIASVQAILEGCEPALTNFMNMSLSVRKTYTRAYLDAKTDAGRKKRKAWMIDRLNRNLKPM